MKVSACRFQSSGELGPNVDVVEVWCRASLGGERQLRYMTSAQIGKSWSNVIVMTERCKQVFVH